MGGCTKGCPEIKRVGSLGRSWRNCLSTIKVCGNDEIIAPSVKILISEQSSAQSHLPFPQSVSFLNSSHNSCQGSLDKGD